MIKIDEETLNKINNNQEKITTSFDISSYGYNKSNIRKDGTRLWLSKKYQSKLYKKYYEKNKEKVKKRTSEYQKTEQGKEMHKRYAKKNAQKINAYMRNYHQTVKGKIVQQAIARRHKAKRRNLGFEPLNDVFGGAEAHHIDKKHIIYIPKEIHHSVKHNLWTGKGMEIMNQKAFDWLKKEAIQKNE